MNRIDSNDLIRMLLLISMIGLCTGCDSGSSSAINEENSASVSPDSSGTPGNNDILSPMMNTPFIYPGVRSPKTFAPEEVNIPDDAAVIGIEEGDQSKAYLCRAMSSMTTHVINDLIGPKPVAVTYCDRTDCARVFSGTEEGVPPRLELGGFSSGDMLLRVNSSMYPQNSESIPLEDRVFEKTTWGQWRAKHPTTTVYLGHQAAEYLIESGRDARKSDETTNVVEEP